jgi:hypothetical protein
VAGNELTHAGGHSAEHSGGHAAEHHEPVVAPDQLKPPALRRLTIAAGLVTVLCLPVMALVGNHEGNVEKVWLIGVAGLMVLGGIVAVFLKKAGLRN